jgi:hypothetical protein
VCLSNGSTRGRLRYGGVRLLRALCYKFHGGGAVLGSNPVVDPQLETARCHPLSLPLDPSRKPGCEKLYSFSNATCTRYTTATALTKTYHCISGGLTWRTRPTFQNKPGCRQALTLVHLKSSQLSLFDLLLPLKKPR